MTLKASQYTNETKKNSFHLILSPVYGVLTEEELAFYLAQL